MRGGPVFPLENGGESTHWASGEKFQGLPVKDCRNCGESKPLAEFPAHKHTRDGLSSWCRDCHREAVRNSRAKHKKPHPRRPCVGCGESFRPSRKDRVYCSEACRQAAKYRRRRKK